MLQAKKISLDTIAKQQELIIAKLEREKEELEKALKDKEFQLELQREVLDTIRGDN